MMNPNGCCPFGFVPEVWVWRVRYAPRERRCSYWNDCMRNFLRCILIAGSSARPILNVERDGKRQSLSRHPSRCAPRARAPPEVYRYVHRYLHKTTWTFYRSFLSVARVSSMADAADEDDVANAEEEEDFLSGMRQNAMDYQAHDTDNDGKLNFEEFCALVREREDADHTDEELRERFTALDGDGSGLVDMHEYVRWSLRDALSRSAQRVIDLFRQWDEDGSGEIDKKEFRMAIRSMGFTFIQDDSEIDTVFDEFDMDGSGKLDYKELNKQLRQGAGSALDPSLRPGAMGEIGTKSGNKHKLRRRKPGEKPKGTSVIGAIDPDSDVPIQEQIRDLLSKNAVRVIDLFREWDDDGNGLVDKKEFRKAMSAMGIQASKEDINAVFDSMDADGGGTLEYGEMNKAFRRGGTVKLDANLQAGAKGSIELKAKNKSSKDLSPGKKGPSLGGSIAKPVAFTNKVKQGAKGRASSSSPTRSAGGASPPRGNKVSKEPSFAADEDDVANAEEEEDFLSGMRQNAMDYQAHDTDNDGKLNFEEFCALVREREDADHTDEELRERFTALDGDGSGLVDMHEYVRWSLRDALSRSAQRVIDLFRQWDEDGSGEIDKKESGTGAGTGTGRFTLCLQLWGLRCLPAFGARLDLRTR